MNTCSLKPCPEPRVEGTLFGRDCGHNNDWIAGRIVRRSDGSFTVPGPQARPTEIRMSPFVRRALAGQLPAKRVAA